MATYVNDLRLKEIATGDESGTWGASTNTNLELIAEAFSYGTEASFSSDADATTTIADGATDPARSLYLKVTSGASLTATRTLTIAPNTVSKIWIIENATSGSQSINISQGSGSNVTIPNGDVKVVYSDGAGSGAAIVDAFINLKVTDPAQTNITSVGALNGGSITSGFGSIDNGSSAITTTGTVTFGTLSDGSINIANFIDDDTFGTASATTVATSESIKAYVDSQVGTVDTLAEILANGNTTGGTDISLSSSDITGTGNINITGTIQSSGNITGTLATAAQPNITSVGTLTGLNVAGTPTFDGLFVDGDTDLGSATRGVSFRTLGTGSYKLSGGNSAASAAAFTIDAKAIDTADLYLATDGVNHLKVAQNGDISFYEDTGTTQALYWDASAESLGIGTTSPSVPLHVAGGSSGTNQSLFRTSSGGGGGFQIVCSDLSVANPTWQLNTFFGEQLAFGDGTSEHMRIDSSGNVGIGTDSPVAKLHIENGDIRIEKDTKATIGFRGHTTGSTALAFRDSNAAVDRMTIDSSGNVGIGTSNPGVNLQVSENGTCNFRMTDSSSPSTYSQFVSANGVLQIRADGGNAQGGSSMQFFVDTDEAMRIDSSGNLLVGTTDTTLYNDSSDEYGMVFEPTGESQFSANNRTLMYLNRQNGDGTIVDFRKDGTTVGSIGTNSSRLNIGSGDAGLLIAGDLDNITPWNSTTGASRDAAVDLGNSGVRFKDLYLSGDITSSRFSTDGDGIKMGAGLGIKFDAYASGNVLDDYEEGSFTPTLTTDGTDFTSVTYDARTGGSYTKVGRLVHFQLTVVTDAITAGSASGGVVIGGLPFTPATVSGAGTDQYTAVSVTFGSNWNAGNNPTSARVNETSAYINLYRDGTTTVAVADAQTGSNDNYINIAGTYTTA